MLKQENSGKDKENNENFYTNSNSNSKNDLIILNEKIPLALLINVDNNRIMEKE